MGWVVKIKKEMDKGNLYNLTILYVVGAVGGSVCNLTIEGEGNLSMSLI